MYAMRLPGLSAGRLPGLSAASVYAMRLPGLSARTTMVGLLQSFIGNGCWGRMDGIPKSEWTF